MVDLAELQRFVDGHRLVQAVDRIPRGHVRLQTAFLYPDGSNIDLFLLEGSSLQNDTFRSRKLSDLGATTEWLLDVQVRPWLSPKRTAFLQDALVPYGVQQEGGALVLPVREWTANELLDKVIHLGQACVRVADLAYTRRSSLQAPILEEVEEILVDAEVQYATNVELEGKFGKKVMVDLLADGAHNKSAILTMSSSSHVLANEVFRKWYDLKVADRTEQRITVYDDRKESYRDDDLQRLETVSTMVPLSDRQMIADLVSA